MLNKEYKKLVKELRNKIPQPYKVKVTPQMYDALLTYYNEEVKASRTVDSIFGMIVEVDDTINEPYKFYFHRADDEYFITGVTDGYFDTISERAYWAAKKRLEENDYDE